jgi:hypothetical protein
MKLATFAAVLALWAGAAIGACRKFPVLTARQAWRPTLPLRCRGAFRKLLGRPHEGLRRPQFHALITCESPKQTDSIRFCSHTVQAPAKPKPFRNHSMASNPRIVRRAVRKD